MEESFRVLLPTHLGKGLRHINCWLGEEKSWASSNIYPPTSQALGLCKARSLPPHRLAKKPHPDCDGGSQLPCMAFSSSYFPNHVLIPIRRAYRKQHWARTLLSAEGEINDNKEIFYAGIADSFPLTTY